MVKLKATYINRYGLIDYYGLNNYRLDILSELIFSIFLIIIISVFLT